MKTLTKAQKQLLAALADGTVIRITRLFDGDRRDAHRKRYVWKVQHAGSRGPKTIRDSVAEALEAAGFLAHNGEAAGYIKGRAVVTTHGTYEITKAGHAEAARLAA